MREAELLVGVVQGAVRLPVEGQPAVLDALVAARIAGVRGDPPAAHRRQEPVQLQLGVVVGVVPGGDDEGQRGTGGRSARQRVDPFDQRDDARDGQRLLRTPGARGLGAQVLVAQRALDVDQMQIGELDEGRQRGTPPVAAAVGAGQVGADDTGPGGAVGEAAVAGGTARGGDGGGGGALGVGGVRGGGGSADGERLGRNRGRCGGDGAGLRRPVAAESEGEPETGGGAGGTGGGEEGTAVESGGGPYTGHARTPRVRTRRRPGSTTALSPGIVGIGDDL